jgi:mono/diheme cytochrome c family protein
MIFATSTARAVGLVILAIVVVGVLAYFVFNMASGKKEVGSEIELAPNRKPYYPDEVLETKKLDRSLTMALLTLGLIGVTLPLYWLAEPGRQEGAVDGFDDVFLKRGTAIYEGFCSNCHGPTGAGGVAAYTITDDAGAFVAQVEWTVPGLTTVLSRFDAEEVTHILNYGRGVMPAWGAPGGGALTTQQIEEVVRFLQEIQVTDEAVIQEQVMEGVAEQARAYILATETDLADALEEAEEALAEAREQDGDVEGAQADVDDAQAAIDEAVADLVERISAAEADEQDQILYGEFLFNNTAGQGEFNCARCHTNGWSYGARSDESVAALIDEWPKLESTGILTAYAPGAGAFGPSLWTVENHYPTAEGQIAFVTAGGGFGSQDSNQMPGFGGREDERLVDAEGNPLRYPALLTQEQIAAVVAYERSLGE